jgi:FMN phosphatase YigB (HAD superfamily)
MSGYAHWPMIKAVFFDIGETLINETRVWSLFADWMGVPRMTMFGVLGGLISQGRDHRELFNILRPDLGWNAFVDRFRTEVGDAFLPEDLYPDAITALGMLKREGYFVGIAGNQPAEREKDLLEMNLPADLIATSAGWGLMKPTAAFFERVVREARCRPDEIAYVGDRVDNDVIPSAAAGLVPIHLIRGPWGYLQANWPAAAKARARVYTLTELVEILKNL